MRPAADAIVRCQPVTASGAVGDILSVDLYVENVADLYGADVRLSFDTSIAQVVDADAGASGVQVQPLSAFLVPDFVIRKTADNSAGTIWYAVTQLNPHDAVSGSGPLARVSFQALKAGSFTMPFTYHKLAQRDGSEIPATTQSCTINFTSPGEATSTPTPTATNTTALATNTPTATPTATNTPSAAQIAGWVYLDTNGDGVRNAGETDGLTGVTINLTLPGGSVVSTLSVGPTGWYQFGDLASGTYTVTEVQPAGYTSTSPDAVVVTVSDSTQPIVNFGEQAFTPTPSPTLIAISTSTATATNTPTNTSVPPTATPTATNTPAPPTETPTMTNTPVPPTETPTATNTPTITPTPRLGTASIQGIVFDDRNRDGVQGLRETGIPGVLIVMIQIDSTGTLATITNNNNNSPVALDTVEGSNMWATVTDAEGIYRVDGLPVGFDYAVIEYDSLDYVSTTPNAVVVSIPVEGAGSAVTANFGDRQTPIRTFLPLI